MAAEQFSIEGTWQGLTVARIITSDLAPRFRAGEFVLIDPARFASIGDEVAVRRSILDFDGSPLAHEGVIGARLARAPEGVSHE